MLKARTFRITAAAVLALTALGGTAMGQTPVGNSPVSRVDTPDTVTPLAGKAPPALAPRPLNLPAPTTYKMPNGLTVILLEEHRVPFVTFQLGIKSGDANDPKNMQGLATITADLLTEGAAKRTSKEIANEVDFIGGAMKAASDADFTVVSGSALSKYSEKFFNILSDVLQQPTFPEEELTLEKTNLLEALNMKRSQPDFLADERFSKVVFGDHAYAVVAPTTDGIKKITRADIVKFHQAQYLPNLSTLVVVGDFKTPEMRAMLDKQLGAWKAGPVPVTSSAAPPVIKGTKIYLIDRPGSVQSNVKIGNLGIKKTDPDYFPVMVANQILGGTANSRLFLNIRENKGYTYGAYSGFSTRKNPGEFAAGADVRTPVTAPSLLEFMYELSRIRTLPVTDAELTSAKNLLTGNFQTGFETQGGVAQRLLEQELYEQPKGYLQNYTQRVMAVKAEDVRRVAHKHIDTNNLVITVVGDAKQIEPELRYFAPVEVYDTNGKLVRTDGKAVSNGG